MPEDYKTWENVRYVPDHANGDTAHPDCENGVVSSVTEKYVFVRYINNNYMNPTAEATPRKNLVHW